MTEVNQSARRRPDASMTLLTAVMERPLDPGYAAAARRKAAGEEPPTSLRRRIITLLLTVAIGIGVVIAAMDLREPQAQANTARELIIEQIRDRTAATEELRVENGGFRDEISELQSQVLGAEAEELLGRTSALEVAVGTTAVTGPGLVITVENSSRSQAGEPGTELERVQDRDLQLVVNGLWASGAEAISINGYRLTALTAIRAAGEAILVDLQPLVSPYEVEAIGDPQAMRSEFARSSAQAHLGVLSSAYSIPHSVSEVSVLELRAADSTQLTHASPTE